MASTNRTWDLSLFSACGKLYVTIYVAKVTGQRK